MTKPELEDLKRWIQLRKFYLLGELSKIRERIFNLEAEIKKERIKKRKEVLKDILFHLKTNESQFLIKFSELNTLESRANFYLETIFPEIPTLG